MLLHKLRTLFRKCLLAMVFLLVPNVSLNLFYVGFTYGKCPVPSLPGESSLDEIILIYPMGRFTFKIFENVFYRMVNIEQKKDMDMVRHAVDGCDLTSKIRFKMILDVSEDSFFNGGMY